MRNYPRRVAERLRLSADIAFEDVSCGAANTSNAEYPQTTFAYNPPQLSEVTARTDLVTVSLGINDAGFASLFTQCPSVAVLRPDGCAVPAVVPDGDG